jgi:hypothetical protein
MAVRWVGLLGIRTQGLRLCRYAIFENGLAARRAGRIQDGLF